jgi:very-short-patch-repair endonuclease
MGMYVLDFYCAEVGLAVEIDGSSHDGVTAKLQDVVRTEHLESRGIRVVRFANERVIGDLGGLLDELRMVLREASTLTPPSPAKGEG